MKQFTVVNEPFDCVVCHAHVPIHASGCRNHCNHCLHSVHVDINPGDRANPCGGVLEPRSALVSSKETRIQFQCQRCRQYTVNKAAVDDNVDVLIALSANPWKEVSGV